MRVSVDVKALLEALQSHNPGADLTGVKAYLFDLTVMGTPTNTPLSRQPMLPREQPPTHVPDQARPYEPEPVEGIGTFAEELSPFAPATPLKGDSLEDDGDAPAESDPIQALAQKVMGPAIQVPKRVAVNAGPPGPKSVRLTAAEKIAKRKELDDLSKLSSKELMERLTNTTTAKKGPGQNQFVDMGNDGPASGGGDLEMG